MTGTLPDRLRNLIESLGKEADPEQIGRGISQIVDDAHAAAFARQEADISLPIGRVITETSTLLGDFVKLAPDTVGYFLLHLGFNAQQLRVYEALQHKEGLHFVGLNTDVYDAVRPFTTIPNVYPAKQMGIDSLIVVEGFVRPTEYTPERILNLCEGLGAQHPLVKEKELDYSDNLNFRGYDVAQRRDSRVLAPETVIQVDFDCSDTRNLNHRVSLLVYQNPHLHEKLIWHQGSP